MSYPAPPSQYVPFYQAAEKQYNVPASLLEALTYVESSYNPNARSSAGAQGIAQFLPSTAQSVGVNPSDPQSSIMGAAKYLTQLYGKCGSWNGALQAYNSGSCSGAPGYASQILGLAGQPQGPPNSAGGDSGKSSGLQSLLSALGMGDPSQLFQQGGFVIVGIAVIAIGVWIAFASGGSGDSSASQSAKGRTNSRGSSTRFSRGRNSVQKVTPLEVE